MADADQRRAPTVAEAIGGPVGLIESSVQYELTTVPGIKNKLFGGDGLFLLRLTGPGRVWTQTRNIDELNARLGKGKLVKLLFMRPSPASQTERAGRVRLSRPTKARTPDKPALLLSRPQPCGATMCHPVPRTEPL